MTKPQWVLDREREQEIMGEPPASGFVPGPGSRALILVVGLVALVGLAVAVTVIRSSMAYAIGRAAVGP